MEVLKNFWKEEEAIGVVEIILILVIIFTPSLVARINTGSIISVTPKFLSFSAHFP